MLFMQKANYHANQTKLIGMVIYSGMDILTVSFDETLLVN